MLTLNWWRNRTLCKPEGEGRYAFFPCGVLWRGCLLREKERDAILNDYARQCRLFFLLFMIIFALEAYTINDLFDLIPTVLATIVVWTIGTTVYFAGRYSYLPRSATRRSFSLYMAGVELQYDGYSTGRLVGMLVTLSLFTIGYSFWIMIRWRLPGAIEASIIAFLILFWTIGAPTICRILRRRWAGR